MHHAVVDSQKSNPQQGEPSEHEVEDGQELQVLLVPQASAFKEDLWRYARQHRGRRTLNRPDDEVDHTGDGQRKQDGEKIAKYGEPRLALRVTERA